MDEYKQRRKLFLDKMEDNSVAFIPSGVEVYRSADTHFPFRQNSNFYYLTGFPEPDALAVLIKKQNQTKYYLFSRPHDPTQEIWTGRRVGQEGAKQQYAADNAFPIQDFQSRLNELLTNVEHIYFPIGENEKFDANLFQLINTAHQNRRKGIKMPSIYHHIDDLIHEMRVYKSEEEIKLMRQAIAISQKAHVAAMKACCPGMKEYQLEAILLKHFYENGSRSPAYTNIVAGGNNACTLHYIDNQDTLTEGDLVLIDAGAEYQNYASDITRTFPVNGKFSSSQRKIYSLVLAAQKAVIAMIKPGIYFNHLQDKALDVLAKGLIELGLIKNEGEIKQFYMHNIGHWLGLDVHDVGSYHQAHEWRQLEPGMILTVEPGIYISKASESVDKAWRGIGIRIEDDVLVTEQGCEVLSAAIPKEIDDIEKIMAK